MLSVDMTSLWGDDNEKIVKGVTEATNNIFRYLKNQNAPKVMFCELKSDINSVCHFWAGNTYVGQPKTKAIKKAFQVFFEAFMQLLLAIKDSDRDYEKHFSKSILYRGTVYRYLGNNQSTDKVIKPRFDRTYVSWSKNPQNDYIESKLYGTMTWISCKISDPFWGIDLDALGCSRNTECEVVFPTIKKRITEIKYISEDDDDET